MKALFKVAMVFLVVLVATTGIIPDNHKGVWAQCEYHYQYLLKAENSRGVVVTYQIFEMGEPIIWRAPQEPGVYFIRLGVADGCATTVWGPAQEIRVAEPTPVPTATPMPTPTATATKPKPTPTSTPTRTAIPSPPPTPRPATVAVSVPTATKAPVVNVARSGTGFDYGIQIHGTEGDPAAITAAVQGLRFHWIKQQVRWEYTEPQRGQYSWESLDALVNTARAGGINVLFSVVAAPPWARSNRNENGPAANNQDFFNYMEALVGHFRGRVQAYEVWNEQNLQREWSTGRNLSPTEYVELLKGAYQTIKRVDPGAVVVSGAPSPTGWNDGVVAIDDALYLEWMYQAGLARWCDAVGAHGATGSNIPPDATTPGYEDPSARFRGPWDSPHHSWSFKDLMRKYRQIMTSYGDGNKRIWVTEFGWAVDQNAPPDRLYAADNTREEQTAWTVGAYQLARSWGFVGPVFLWNLNFPTGEQAMWRIEGTGTDNGIAAARGNGQLP